MADPSHCKYRGTHVGRFGNIQKVEEVLTSISKLLRSFRDEASFRTLVGEALLLDGTKWLTRKLRKKVDRKLRRLERETRALEIENDRRRQKGLETIDDINELDEDEDTESAPDGGTGVDFFLQEAGNILADLIDFSSNKMEKSTPSELALKNRPAERKP